MNSIYSYSISIAAGFLTALGLWLQTKGVLTQNRSGFGLILKFCGIILLLVSLYLHRDGIFMVPVLFGGTLFLSLCGATLARKNRLR